MAIAQFYTYIHDDSQSSRAVKYTHTHLLTSPVLLCLLPAPPVTAAGAPGGVLHRVDAAPPHLQHPGGGGADAPPVPQQPSQHPQLQ